MSYTQDNIKFIAVARATDKVVACSYMHGGNHNVNTTVYMEMLNKVLRAPTWQQQVEPNSRHTLECDPNKFHFTMDNEQRVFVTVSTSSYPIQLAFKLLSALQEALLPSYGARVLTCSINGLDKDCHKILQRIATDYDDRTKQDKISKVMQQVDDVKSVMHDNIQTVLANSEKMENVEEKTNELNRQAQAFRNTGRNLRRKMWWKDLKLTLMIGTLVVLVLIILLASLGAFKKRDSS